MFFKFSFFFLKWISSSTEYISSFFPLFLTLSKFIDATKNACNLRGLVVVEYDGKYTYYISVQIVGLFTVNYILFELNEILEQIHSLCIRY